MSASRAVAVREWCWCLAVTVGVALRLDQLQEQILLEDEWHQLHAAVRLGYTAILTQFGWTDRSIPLTLFTKLTLDTVGISEWSVRAPALLAGLAALIVLPMMLRAAVGKPTADGLAWLLAVSPLHVYFTRYARPYSISLLLVFAGALAFASWWQAGERRALQTYAACAVLAPFFHLSALAPAIAPLGLALAEARVRKSVARHRLRRLLQVCGVIAVGLALLLGPAFLLNVSTLAYKAGRTTPVPATFAGALELFTGSRHVAVQTALVALAFVGLARLWSRQARLLLVLGTSAGAAVAATLIIRPTDVFMPMVFARYALACLPVLLLASAAGLAWIEARLPRRIRLPQGGLPVLAALALAWLGPLPATHERPNNWTNHGLYQYSYGSAFLGWSCHSAVPAFYRALANEAPGSVRILEAPWFFGWQNAFFPCYQRVHRQFMAIGFASGPGGAASEGRLPRAGELPVLTPGSRFHLRNFIHVLDHAALRRRGIRYVVFHADLADEMDAGPEVRDELETAVRIEHWVAHYRLVYGPPAWQDDRLIVFDVARLRPAQWEERARLVEAAGR